MQSSSIQGVLNVLILVLIGITAIGSRLFSVLRYESIIHEYDPWFNFRATKYLVSEGFYAFLNWFDHTAWYPLGRVVGGTVFPGLMITSAAIFYLLERIFLIPVDIRHICVMLAPAFSALTALMTYHLTAIADDSPRNKTSALFAALFIAVAPGYISRSVAGSYDNEAIAIFLLMATFYFYLRSLSKGSPFSAAVAAFFYFYMVSAWGGYVFIINLIPLHVFTLLVMRRYTWRLYISYSTFYILGTMASMLVPFVGVNPSRTCDHMAALGTFGLLQLIALVNACKAYLSPLSYKKFLGFVIAVISTLSVIALSLIMYSGVLGPWAGRFYSLWDTEYAKVHLPIIASVSEHQPTTWASFFFDLHLLIILLFPSGIFLLLKYPTVSESSVFLILYALSATYFAGVMVRLMLTLTPVVAIISAISCGKLFNRYLYIASVADSKDQTCEKTPLSNQMNTMSSTSLDNTLSSESISKTASSNFDVQNKTPFNVPTAPLNASTRIFVLSLIVFLLFQFIQHCTWVTSTAYSSPSVVLSSYDRNGQPIIIDDFREAFYFLRKNVPSNSKVLSWWDYGYQLSGFCNTPEHPIVTIVDNNTWNNTHIATVGKILASNEIDALPILRQLSVNYILILSGVVSGFAGDDMNKFLWMIRIAAGEFPDDLAEADFYNSHGQYAVDTSASPVLKESLLYKMTYYKIHEIMGKDRAADRARNNVPLDASVDPKLSILEEVFSSENYIVRIYRVKEEDPLGRPLVLP